MDQSKRIEVLTLEADQLNSNFGNPRKIKREKRQELMASLESYGDFGVFVIDENNSLIAGNQRWQIIMGNDPKAKLLCKRLVGYTEAEKRAINIKDNTHSGEWDLDLLAQWTADLTVDLGIESKEKPLDDAGNKDMELIMYEKYDYVLIVTRNELDYNELCDKLGITGKRVKLNDKKKLKARAVWYDQSKFK